MRLKIARLIPFVLTLILSSFPFGQQAEAGTPDDSPSCPGNEPGTPYTLMWWSQDGRLAFTCNYYGNSDIYVWDHTTLTNVSNNPATDAAPAWSSEGRLAFLSSRDGNSEIYIWDGESLTNITQTPNAEEYYLKWSDNGQLAFVSHFKYRYDTYIWDGGTLTNITESLLTGPYFPFAWGPEGQLALGYPMMEGFQISVWDDGQFTEIPTEFLFDNEAEWSGDGRLALAEYDRYPDSVPDWDRVRDVIVWDGTQVINVSQSPYTNDMNPTWSDDGRLAYASISGDIWSGNRRVYVWDGTNVINVPGDESIAALPSWSSDGRIVFGVSDGEKQSDIYIWDGQTALNITEDFGPFAYRSGWSDDGRIAFYGHNSPILEASDIYVWDAGVITNITQQPDTHRSDFIWSDDGQLAFLTDIEDWRMKIFVWNGTEVINVTDHMVE
jgi:Tol biopolymer transport system component